MGSDRLAERLRERGYRATPQRLAVGRAMQRLAHHATADQVAEALARDMPGLALPTVYAALEVLETLGDVRRVATIGGTAYFETTARPHHHAICTRCGTIEDLEAEAGLKPVLEAARRVGFADARAEVTILGTCPRCRGRTP
jgi:Fe2+ or Zn2+ uptake regulation protein